MSDSACLLQAVSVGNNRLDVLHLLQDDLYAILPALSILELVIILIYLGHISGCFFYLLSTPSWQTKGEGAVLSGCLLSAPVASILMLAFMSHALRCMLGVPRTHRQGSSTVCTDNGLSHTGLMLAGEKALIASGEMTTWIPRAFGGDRIIVLPTNLNITAYLRPNATLSGSSVNSSTTSSLLRVNLARTLPPTATQVSGFPSSSPSPARIPAVLGSAQQSTQCFGGSVGLPVTTTMQHMYDALLTGCSGGRSSRQQGGTTL